MPYGTVNADIIQSSVSGVSLGAGNASIMKNRIINGAMLVSQRGTSFSVDGANIYSLDRWMVEDATDGAFSVTQSSDAPTGFINSLLVTVTTADASIGATQLALVRQRIEGLNATDMAWGTASAKTVTLSFWVKSSLTGTFGGTILNSAANRSYPYTYTISAANTWEQKSITIAGDTTGTWLYTNGIFAQVDFSMAAGSTYTGTPNTWSGNLYLGATGQTQVMSTLNATWQVTGVQLEVGSSATGFEYRQYQQELALCQRYLPYFTGATAIGAGTIRTTTVGALSVQFPVSTRTAPTGLVTNATNINNLASLAYGGSDSGNMIPSFSSASINSANVLFSNSGAAMTVGQGAQGFLIGAGYFYFTGCEL